MVVSWPATISSDTDPWHKPSRKLEPGMYEMLQECETLHNFALSMRSDEFAMLVVAGERRLYTANTAMIA
jgi:hypothetical protein